MPKAVRAVRSTYRLQLHAGFGFADAERVVPYLARLGVSHLYLSPVLQAVPGSMHGYDVVDHTQVSAELGGRGGLERLAEASQRAGLGLVVDVVPNHMAIPSPSSLNKPLWDTLRFGRESAYAHWFDVEWDLLDDKIGLAVLGKSLDQVIRDGELTIESTPDGDVLAYFEQRLPLDPGTQGDDLRSVVDQQHYLLADWHDKDTVLNYRRFFDVDSLIAVRVELEDVFVATHQLLVDLCEVGVIDGFRVDHPDGLADPEQYLNRLRDATGGAWVVVEKILAGSESLPTSWSTAGTTGYDAIQAVQTALVPPTGDALDSIWRSTGWPRSLGDTEDEAKQLVIRQLLVPEVARLTRLAVTAARDAREDLDAGLTYRAIAELLRHVEVYRAYLRVDTQAPHDSRRQLMRLASLASETAPDLSEVIARVIALLGDTTAQSLAARDLIVRFQQVSGPVMAKGIEDTTFYRFHRLVALNEVGGDPAVVTSPDAAALHRWASRQEAHSPHGMTALSTHDTKRSEDVRARLIAAAEDVAGWQRVWRLVEGAADDSGVDFPTAYLAFQTLVGSWPISADRLRAYLEKATREAKLYTTWQQPDSGYEGRVHALADHCLADGPVSAAIASWVDELAAATRAVTLAAKLLQLMLPGVPDVYQGSEIVIRTLVDPDNRQPVDYDDRSARLARLAAGAPADLDDEKLLVTSTALRLRGPDAPDGGYQPLTTTSSHALGFARGDVCVVVTRAPWQLARDGWQGAVVTLPSGSWLNEFDGAPYDGDVACERLLANLPVALLSKADR